MRLHMTPPPSSWLSLAESDKRKRRVGELKHLVCCTNNQLAGFYAVKTSVKENIKIIKRKRKNIEFNFKERTKLITKKSTLILF